MAKELNIVLIPIGYSNGRKKAEEILNKSYRSTTALRIQLAKELESRTLLNPDIGIHPINVFITACNNSDISLDNYYISYVYFGE